MAWCALRWFRHRLLRSRIAKWRWRLVDLCQWVWEMYRISISPQTMSRELRAMDYRKLSVRPGHHGQVEGAIALFKRVSPACWSKSRAIKASMRAA